MTRFLFFISFSAVAPIPFHHHPSPRTTNHSQASYKHQARWCWNVPWVVPSETSPVRRSWFRHRPWPFQQNRRRGNGANGEYHMSKKILWKISHRTFNQWAYERKLLNSLPYSVCFGYMGYVWRGSVGIFLDICLFDKGKAWSLLEFLLEVGMQIHQENINPLNKSWLVMVWDFIELLVPLGFVKELVRPTVISGDVHDIHIYPPWN